MLLSRSLEVGGAERQLVALAKELKKRGHRVTIALFYRRGPLAEEAEEAAIELVDLAKRGRWDSVIFLARTIAAVSRRRPDIIYSFLGGANVVASLVRPFARGTRVVWTILNTCKDPSTNHLAAHLAFSLETALSRTPSAIISNSSAGREWAIKRGFPANRIAVVPNGIDVERFRPDATVRIEQRRRFGLADHEIAVGVLARLNSTKDYPTFLRAASLLQETEPNARFLCVGSGEETEALQSLAHELRVTERVIFTGEMDAAAALNAFDIACSPSVTEGFSNSIAEAMACGLPCIVTDVGDSAAIVGDTGIVVPPSSPEALSAAIRRQIRDLGNYDPAAPRRRIEQNFSLAAMVDRTLEVFQSVL